ncbi:MAG: tetratricopeptide repeat protein, partial [Planctomycetales bacterium]|nr:tetratricopeptide repeat protein [Planctomycetales bacterium]
MKTLHPVSAADRQTADHLRTGHSQAPRHRQFNWKLLIISVVLLAVVLPAVHFWHQRQLANVSEALLRRADQLEAEEKFYEASNTLFRYVNIHEGHKDVGPVMVRLAQTYDRFAQDRTKKSKAISWYLKALAAAPSEVPLYARLAELQIETGQYSLAEEIANKGLKLAADDFACHKQRTLARHHQLEQGRPVDVDLLVEEFSQLLAAHPDDIDGAQAFAGLLRQHVRVQNEFNPAQLADQTMNNMVQANGGNFQAYLVRHKYRLQHELADADKDLDAAFTIAPNDQDVLVTAGDYAYHQGEFQNALDYYQRLVAENATRADAHLGVGQSLRQLGRIDEAITAFQQGLAQADPLNLALNVQLTDTLINEGRLDEADATIGNLETAIGQLASEGIESLRAWAVASRDLLQGKLYLARRDYGGAIDKLTNVATTTSPQAIRNREGSVSFHANTLLGDAHAALSQWQESALAYERAIELAPHVEASYLAAAKSWTAADQIEKALNLCEKLTVRPQSPASVWLLVIRLELERQLRKPADERTWQALDRAFQTVEQAAPDEWEFQLEKARYLAVRDKVAGLSQAMQLLLTVEQSHEATSDMWSRLVMLYASLGQPAEADRALERLEQLESGQFRTHAIRAQLFMGRQQWDVAQNEINSLKTLATGGDANQQTLISTLEQRLVMESGDTQSLKSLLENQLVQQTGNLQALAQLGDLHLAAGNLADLDQTIQQIKQVEGEQGTLWKFFEARKLLQAIDGQSNQDQLRTVRQLLRDIEVARPWWPGGGMLRGLIAEYQNLNGDAIDAYVALLHSGFHRPEVYEHLVRLLYQEQRYSEAVYFLRYLNRHEAAHTALTEIGVSAASSTGQWDVAVQLAKQAMDQAPSDILKHIWYAQTLNSAGRMLEADAAYQTALDQFGDDIRIWVAYLSYLAQQNQLSQVEEAIAQVEQHAEMGEADRSFLLAQIYELLGDVTNARQQYAAATKAAPNNLTFQLRYAILLASSDATEAERLIRDVLQKQPDNRLAQRTLAMMLGTRTDDDAWTESQQLLTASSVTSSSTADQRLKAVLLIRRGGREDLAKARQILAELVTQSFAQAEDHILFARLLETQGDIDLASEQYQLVCNDAQATVRHLGMYVAFLLRQGNASEATNWLNRLESAAPPSVGVIQLNAKWLRLQGQEDRIETLVDSFAKSQLDQISSARQRETLMLDVAKIYEDVPMQDQAERWYQQAAAEFNSSQEALLLFWAGHQQEAKAVDFCLKKLNQDFDQDLVVSLSKVLVLGRFEQPVDPRAIQALAKGLQQFPQNSSLWFYAGNLQLKQGKVAQAINL